MDYMLLRAALPITLALARACQKFIPFPTLENSRCILCLLSSCAKSAGGELFALIRKTRRFPENDARYFFQQLICGMEYLHGAGVTHRDIKLENTLIGGNKPGTLVKICDFGYSKRPEVEQSQCKSVVGTPAYLAPEVLANKPYKGAAVDVWSCGVMLYVMLVGAYPFEDPTDRCARLCLLSYHAS